jgi:chitodextrinase
MGIISESALKNMNAMLTQAKINSVANTDEQALEVQSLYPEWDALEEGATLKVGERVNYNGLLYNVLQEHQKQATWNPVDAPSLFAQVLIVDPSVIPEWVQPDSTNPYMKGDKVTHNGNTWESLVDNNVWEP